VEVQEAARWAASFCFRHAGAICAFILKRFLNLNRLSLRVENAV
jgi:hypothetical protein